MKRNIIGNYKKGLTGVMPISVFPLLIEKGMLKRMQMKIDSIFIIISMYPFYIVLSVASVPE